MNYLKKPPRSFLEPVFVLSWMLQLISGTISSYSQSSYIIKITTTIFAATVSYLYFSQNKNISFIINKKIIKLLSVMLIIFFVSALTSMNTEFGLEKSLNFLLFQVPPIIIVPSLLMNKTIIDAGRLTKFLLSLGALIALIVIVFIPFDQSSGIAYVPSIKRWSHVFTGRFLSVLIIISFLITYAGKLKPNIWQFTSYILILTAVLLTELRAAALGIIFISFLFIVFEYLPKQPRKTKIYITLATIAVLALTTSLLLSFGRFAELQKLIEGGALTDGSILSRIDAAKIVWEGFKDAPILGHGFGSFYSDCYSSLGLMMKYPHNIFLEAIFEFGIIGLIALLILLYIIFRYVARYNRLLIYFFSFSLWMSMFSKDFATQSFLWIGIGFVSLIGEKDQRRKGEKDKRLKGGRDSI